MATIFDAKAVKALRAIEKMASAGGAAYPSYTVNHQLRDSIPGDAVSQLHLSAVNAPPSLKDIVERLKGGVKTVAPVATAGGLPGMPGKPEEAAASVPETASEQAAWSQWEWMPEPRRPVTPWDGSLRIISTSAGKRTIRSGGRTPLHLRSLHGYPGISATQALSIDAATGQSHRPAYVNMRFFCLHDGYSDPPHPVRS